MCKDYNQLTIRERYMIEDLIQEGKAQNYTAERFDRNKSTIFCGVARQNSPIPLTFKFSEIFFAHSDTFWSNFNKFIIGDIFESLFQTHIAMWSYFH